MILPENFSKNCSQCGNLQTYKTKHLLQRAIDLNTKCKKCSGSIGGKSKTIEGRKRIAESNKLKPRNLGSIWTQNQREIGSLAQKKRYKEFPVTQETRLKIKERFKIKENRDKCINKAMLGKHHSSETKRKMRVSMLNRIINGNSKPYFNIGKIEKQLLDLQEHRDNCKIQRQYHIKKLGYVVDGYCLETNTVYEVYEKRHDKQVFKDLDRETEICNHLSCDFIILWEKR